MSLKFAFSKDGITEAGVDEAGRGCLAGPVFAAAVVLNPDEQIDGLNDSKKLGLKDRLYLESEIESKALGFGTAFCDNNEIDRINILNASILAMHRALDKLKSKPELIIVDGNRFKQYHKIRYETIVKGDGKFMSIAAASILAKCARDKYMLDLHEKYNHFSWDLNKGYPTLAHRDAIRKYGPCSYHRKSFKLLPDNQLTIFNRK